jgi:hypothetical protein
VDVTQARPGHTAVAKLLKDRGMRIHSWWSSLPFALHFMFYIETTVWRCSWEKWFIEGYINWKVANMISTIHGMAWCLFIMSWKRTRTFLKLCPTTPITV